MSLDFSGLGDISKAQTSAGGVKGLWRPLEPGDLGEGAVLFYDQSLTATGWVSVVNGLNGVAITGAGKIKDIYEDDPKGIERDLKRAVEIFEQAYVQIDAARKQGYEIVHESPPNPSQVRGGGTGSMSAAVAVRCACALAEAEITMLGAQPGKKLVCGSAKADKAEVHAELKKCFDWIQGSHQVTNEATRDALIGALLWLYRRPKG